MAVLYASSATPTNLASTHVRSQIGSRVFPFGGADVTDAIHAVRRTLCATFNCQCPQRSLKPELIRP